MVYTGTVQNGVVVFENGIRLPDGTPVRVETISKEASNQTNSSEEDALLNISNFAEDIGVPDLSVNIDHYLYGHPKATHGQ
jgi:hypothetical protein